MFVSETWPASLRELVGNYRAEVVTVGLSKDAVYRLHGETIAYLKIGDDLRGEHDRLRWLEGRLPAPRVLHYVVEATKHYLLTTEVPGVMTHEVDLPYLKRVQLMAEGARMWHALPALECPFDQRIDIQIRRAQQNMAAGLVNADHFDIYRHGRTARDLIEEIQQTRPAEDDLVVTHGDYCLPNILVDPVTQQITGFVDLGRMGVADRFVDLAIGARSITYNLGGIWVEPFMVAYGLSMDRAKYNFYTALDEFF